MRDVRVLVVDPDLAAAYCGRLFAGVGSTVVVAEPPDGCALRTHEPMVPTADGPLASALWEHLAAGMGSAVPDDGELDELLAWADVVVSTVDGDADAAGRLDARIRAVRPDAVHVVTSGFGLTGPYRDWRRSPLTDWAAGGQLYLTGEPDREPVQGGGPWASYLTGATAAIGAMAALLHSARTGEGQLVDVGALEAMAGLHQWTITMYTHTGCIKRRWGNRFGESVHPIALYQASDGWISIVSPTYPQFEALCLLIDAPELLVDEELQAPAVRFDRAHEIDPRIDAWLATRTCRAAVAELQGAGVPASLVLTMTDVLEDAQLAARDYWLQGGRFGPQARRPHLPFRTDAADGDVHLGPAPALGADTDAALDAARHPAARPPRPAVDLAAVAAVEFGRAWAGPLAGRFLGDLGVDVAMVEHPAARGVSQRTDPDPDWSWGQLPAPPVRFPVFPNAEPGERWWNRMGLFNKMNRGKRSVCLDAKEGAGPEILRRLVATADLVLHNYSPKGARTMGIDAAGARRDNPDAVTISMTGYGETGPLATFLSYGPVLQAHGGFDEATGYIGSDGPTRLGLAFPDPVGGVHGTFAALVALWERARTGGPVHVDLSQLEALLSIGGELLLAASVTGQDPPRHGNRAAGTAPQGVYPAAGDDAWIAVSVTSDESWARLAAVVALADRSDLDLAGRTAAHDELDAAIAAWTAARPAGEAAAELQALGIAAFPVMTNGMLVEDPHLRQRGFVVTWDQTDVGEIEFPGFPIHFSTLPVRLTGCPGLGADNEAVLGERLGLTPEDVAALLRQGVLADRPPR